MGRNTSRNGKVTQGASNSLTCPVALTPQGLPDRELLRQYQQYYKDMVAYTTDLEAKYEKGEGYEGLMEKPKKPERKLFPSSELYLEIKENPNLARAIDLGMSLCNAWEFHEKQRLENQDIAPWADWVQEHLGLREVEAMKLLEFADIVKDYPKFRNLEMSFKAMYKMRDNIKDMLRNPEIAQKWK